MEREAKIYVAGHSGLAGSAILRALEALGFENLPVRSSRDLDLRDQRAARDFFESEKPDYVFGAAAKVGGIAANRDYPAEFIYDNLMIQANIIDSAWRCGVKKLVFLGSTCIYPKHAPQPLREDYLLSGPLEPSNEAYAIAKIAGLKMCEAYARQYGFRSVTVMPTNLYGPGDNFDLEKSHVIPALMRKAHEAKMAGAPRMTVWGSGAPLREFLHIDDMAQACIFCMRLTDGPSMANAGSGAEISIRALAELICSVVGYKGELSFDASMPDGTPRKLSDISVLTDLGWKARIPLAEGLADTYRWYREEGAKRL